MNHHTNVRDIHALLGLVPYVELVADNHKDMYAAIHAAKDNEGSREAFLLRYSNAIVFLRDAIGKVRDLQREIQNELVDKMEEVGEEIEGILAPQRKPSTDEHE